MMSDVAVTLGGGDGVLGPALDDPSALLFVAVPEHQAAGGEAAADQLDSLVDVGALISDIVGGRPMVTALSPPLALNSETLGQGVEEGVGDSLGEAGEEVQAGMTLPGKSPGHVRETVLAESLATLAPVVLAVSVSVAITVGGNGLVVDGTAQVPGESPLVGDGAPGPVGVNDGGLLVGPVVAVDLDAGFPELHVLVDMSGVGASAFNHEGDNAPDIDLFVASLGGHPVGGVLTADQTLADGTLGLEVLGNDIDIAGPGTLGAGDVVRRPDVSAILTPPVAGHVEGVLIAGVLLVATLDVSEAVMAEATPDPRAVGEWGGFSGFIREMMLRAKDPLQTVCGSPC